MGASSQQADKLTRQVQEMVTLSGFITVVDTASFPDITVSLRRRIEAGEVLGPRIYTAGAGLQVHRGTTSPRRRSRDCLCA